MAKKYIVGIDEVGRGPLAGPVSVGIVVCRTHFMLEGVGDSKQMSETARERVYAAASEMMLGGALTFGVFSTAADVVDRNGIEAAIQSAVSAGLRALAPDPGAVEVVLDGRLRAPNEYRQQSIVHGDALVPAIGLAAIVAKVERDRYMREVAHRSHPVYGFNAHKGYGTEAHYEALRVHGLCPLHRRSYLESLVLESPHV